MAVIGKVEGVDRLVRQLDKLMRSRDKNASVIVGYTANYAVHVHETNRNYRTGQWKFLETPAREKASEIGKIIKAIAVATGSLTAGLLAGGRLLQRFSQKIVPVDTGNLKGSAFTRVE